MLNKWYNDIKVCCQGFCPVRILLQQCDSSVPLEGAADPQLHQEFPLHTDRDTLCPFYPQCEACEQISD